MGTGSEAGTTVWLKDSCFRWNNGVGYIACF